MERGHLRIYKRREMRGMANVGGVSSGILRRVRPLMFASLGRGDEAAL